MGGGSLTDYNNNPKQQQTQSVKCWIYSPLCATTCQQEHPLSESRVWIQDLDLISHCWESFISICAQEKSFYFLLGQFMEMLLYQKLLSYDTLNFSGEHQSKPQPGSHSTNNPINSSQQKPSEFHQRQQQFMPLQQLRGIQTANLTRNSQFGPLLSLKWNWILRLHPI